MTEQVRITEAQVYRGKDGDWRWRPRAANHETIAESSEGYRHKADAEAACRASIPEDVEVEVRGRG